VQESALTLEIIGEIDAIENIAAGASVKVRSLLRKMYTRGRWRKRKGIGTVRSRMAISAVWSYIGTKRTE